MWELMEEIVATYRRHGWQVQRVLMRASTRAQLGEQTTVFAGINIQNSEIDALWFSRASQKDRDAWELRLIAEHQYALFESFNQERTEDERERVRQEMENRMHEHVAGS
jgi:hypothetical protein